MKRTLIRKYADPGYTVDVYCKINEQRFNPGLVQDMCKQINSKGPVLYSTKTFKTIEEVKAFVATLGRHPDTDKELGFENFDFYRIIEHTDGFYEIEFEPGELTPPE